MDILTVHLNDYFQCDVAATIVPKRYWDQFHTRIEATTLDLLDLLDAHDAHATFFASGWIADRVPSLLAEIVNRGHEIASTGYSELPIKSLSEVDLRAEVVQSRNALERACGREVIGFRGSGWLNEKDTHILRILAMEGIRYDSSFCHLGLKLPGRQITGPTEFTFGGHSIWELPIPSAVIVGFRFPLGGTCLRQLPDALIRQRIRRWHARETAPWLLYFQVTELDTGQPRITALPKFRSVQKYRNIPQMRERVARYLKSYAFESVSSHLGLVTGPAPVREVPAKTATPLISDSGVQVPLRSITIVVPCYQEQDAIAYLGNALRSFSVAHAGEYDVNYVLVDDGSSDATLDQLHAEFGDNSKARIVQHETNRGVAAAIMTGIRTAQTRTVCVIDCDCSYDPETLALLIPELRNGVAMVTASPYHKDGRVINVPGWRLFLSRVLSGLYRLMLTTQLATYTSCCRAYDRDVVMGLEIRHSGFLGVSEIVIQLDEAGAKIVEVPATLEARILGTSKMKTVRTICAHLGELWTLALSFRRRSRASPASTPSG